MTKNSVLKQKRKRKQPQDADGMASHELLKNAMTANKRETKNKFPKFKFIKNHNKTILKANVQAKEQVMRNEQQR